MHFLLLIPTHTFSFGEEPRELIGAVGFWSVLVSGAPADTMLTLAALVIGLLPGQPLRAGMRQQHAALVTSSKSRAGPLHLAAYAPFSRAELEGIDGAAPKEHFVFKTNELVRLDTDDYSIELFRKAQRPAARVLLVMSSHAHL